MKGLVRETLPAVAMEAVKFLFPRAQKVKRIILKRGLQLQMRRLRIMNMPIKNRGQNLRRMNGRS